MKSGDRRILKNASVMFVTQLFTWGLAFLTTLFFPRYLGANGLGQFHLASSIWSIVGILAAFGMDAIIVREVARNPGRTGDLFASSALLRSLLFLFGAGAAILYSRWAGYSSLTMQVILIAGFSNFIGLLTGVCVYSLQGLERIEFTALGQAVERTVTAVISIGMLLLGFGVITIALVNVAGSLIGFAIQFIALRRLQPLRFKIELQTIQWLLKTSFPLLLFSSFIVIYGQIDTIILSLLLNEESVGLYSVTDRLYGTLLFIPTTFIIAAYPALSRLFANDADHFTKLVRKSFDLMFLVAVPIGFGLFVIARSLVVLLFGAGFEQSGPILTLRALVLIFTYMNMLIGIFLLASDKQKPWAAVLGIATFATIPLDIIFVPMCERLFGNGAMGGAISYMITESFMFTAALYLLPKGLLGKANLFYAGRVLLAGVGMVAIVWLVRDAFIVLPVLIGVASNLALLVLLRVITKDEWHLLRELSVSAIQRFRNRPAHAASVQ